MKRLLVFMLCVQVMLAMAQQKNDTELAMLDQMQAYVQSQIDKHEISTIHCLFTDMHGKMHEVTIPSRYFGSLVKNGTTFDGSSIPGMSGITKSDMLLQPDLNTFSIKSVSGEKKSGQIICDVYQDDQTAYQADGRTMLKEAIAQADQEGYAFYVGPELEFFVCDRNGRACDQNCYFGAEHDKNLVSFKHALLTNLIYYDIAAEKIHHEVAPGQYEISIAYDNPLAIADQLVLAKQVIKATSSYFGMGATFMPKPYEGKNGSGMHIHFSLWDKKTGKNLFYDQEDANHLSQTGKYFIAGILKNIAELNLIFNPSVNSYKRLVPGFEAPVNICWGKKNRSAMIRLPQINKGQSAAMRAEIRTPDPLCNPYLAFTALLKMGLQGIKEKAVLPDAVEQNLYCLSPKEFADLNICALPKSMLEAVYNLQASSLAQVMFGETFVDAYSKAKLAEAKEYSRTVSRWEIRNYFTA